jgi:hypothetical protein
MKLVEDRKSLEARASQLDKVRLGDLKVGDKFIDDIFDLGEILGYDHQEGCIIQWLNPDVSGVLDYEEVEDAEKYGDTSDLKMLNLLKTKGITEGNFNISEAREMVYPYEKWIPDTKLARKLYKIIAEESGKVRIL